MLCGRRSCLGMVVLILVAIIWVASSELTGYLFKNFGYDKPFFTTYFKSSLFLVYLLTVCCRKNPSAFLPSQNPNNPSLVTRTSISTPTYETLNKTADQRETVINSEEGGIDSDFQPKRRITETETLVVLETGTPQPKPKKRVTFNEVTEVRHLQRHIDCHLKICDNWVFGWNSSDRNFKKTVFMHSNLAFKFVVFWFLGNYMYQLALEKTEASVVNVLSCSSSAFVIILSFLFPSGQSDKVNLTKIIAIGLVVTGVIFTCEADHKFETGALGIVFSLVGAFSYACYLVFLKFLMPEKSINIMMFFGFIGLYTFIFLWPLFFIFDTTGFEIYKSPSTFQWLILLANGFIGTVISDALWLFGAYLTSSLAASLALSLTIPLTLLTDYLLKGVEIDLSQALGCIPVFFGFVLALMEWDPLLSGFHLMYKCFSRVCLKFCRRRMKRCEDADDKEALISPGSSDITNI